MPLEDTRNDLTLTKKRKLDSFSMENVPREALSSQNVDEILQNLENINDIAEIEGIQKKLQGDYKLLAKQFGSSRLSRVDAFINKIEEIQSQLKKNTVSYDEFVRNNLPQLDYDTGAESVSQMAKRSLKRKRNGSQAEVLTQAGSPPPERPLSPPLSSLPIFTESFEKVMDPFKRQLTSLRNKYEYESKLIEDTIRQNVELTWRQSIKDRMELRKKFRDEKSSELTAIENDFFNETRNAHVSRNEKRFRTSTRKVGERKHARYVSQDQQREIDQRVRRFNTFFTVDKKPVYPALDYEVQNDLELIRSKASGVKIEKIEANYLYLEQPIKKEAIGPTTMTDLVNNEIEERGSAGPQFQMAQEIGVKYPTPTMYQNYVAPPPPEQQSKPQQQQMPPPQQAQHAIPQPIPQHIPQQMPQQIPQQIPQPLQHSPPSRAESRSRTQKREQPQQQQPQQQQPQQQLPPQNQLPPPPPPPGYQQGQSPVYQPSQQYPQHYIPQQSPYQQQPSPYLQQPQFQAPGYYNPHAAPPYYNGAAPGHPQPSQYFYTHYQPPPPVQPQPRN